MKTFEAIRLFGPMALGVAFALVFTVFMLSTLKGAQSATEESIASLETQAKKYADLNEEKKVKVAEWLFTQDVGGYRMFFETAKDIVKTYALITIFLVSAVVVQVLSLLSYYSLEKKYKNAINRNGLRLTVTLFVLGLFYGTYLAIKGRYWISDVGTFWLFVAGACITAAILWRLVKRSMAAAWLLLGLTALTFGSTLYFADYAKLVYPAIHLYLALEATLSVHGLRAEESNNGDVGAGRRRT